MVDVVDVVAVAVVVVVVVVATDAWKQFWHGKNAAPHTFLLQIEAFKKKFRK